MITLISFLGSIEKIKGSDNIFAIIFFLSLILLCLVFTNTKTQNNINITDINNDDLNKQLLVCEFIKEIDSYYQGLSFTEPQSFDRSVYVNKWEDRKSYWKKILGNETFKNIYLKTCKNYL